MGSHGGISGERSLEVDVITLEKDMSQLKEKTEALETAVGHKSSGAALLSMSVSAGPLSDRVKALEADAADVNSRVGSMEQEVLGSSEVSLASVGSAEVGLQARVTALQAKVGSLVERAHKLES